MKDNEKITKALKAIAEAINNYAENIPQPQPDFEKGGIEIDFSKVRFDSFYDPDLKPHKENPMVGEDETMIEEETRKLFKKDEPELKVGQWYKSKDYADDLFCIQKINGYEVYHYGIEDDKWKENDWFHRDYFLLDCVPATDSEVESALTEEAKRRGFKEGQKISLSGHETICDVGDEFHFFSQLNTFGIGSWGECVNLFKKGNWATIIEQPEFEETENGEKIFTKPSPHYVDMRVLHELSTNEIFLIQDKLTNELKNRL